MISRSTIAQILDFANIDEVISDFVTLKKRGVNMIARCPFHDEKTPSFTVSPAKGIYKCFGCGAGGNAVNFLMEHEKYSYPEALKYLAKKYGIDVEEEQTEEDIETKQERESLFVVLSFAQQYFTDNLHKTDEGKAIGLSYFKERGLSDNTITEFQLGYSLDKWDGFTQAARDKAYKLEFLEKTGLSIAKDKRYYDRFRGRVIFPIHSLSGRVIGFGGRVLKSTEKSAKYINSPESEVYEKRRVLYGMHLAQKSIIREDNCYIVEGYTDVISLHQAGVINVVASSGTSLTDEQIRLIRRFTQNITILFDGDSAGIKASVRGIDIILEAGMNVKVVLFPDGEDPDSYAAKTNGEELKQFITSNARDFIDFKTHLLLKESGEDPVKKTAMIGDIVASIAAIPNAIAHSVHIKETSKKLEISEQALFLVLNKIRRKKIEQKRREKMVREGYSDQASQTLKSGHPGVDGDENLFVLQDKNSSNSQEEDIIRLLLNYGNRKIVLNATEKPADEKGASPDNKEAAKENIEITVARFIINEISNDEIKLENISFQKILNEFSENIGDNDVPDQQHFINHLDKEMSKLAVDLVSTPYSLSDNWEKHGIHVQTEEHLLRQAVEKSVYSLKMAKLKKMMDEIQNHIKNTPEDANRKDMLQEYHRIIETKKVISKHLGRVVG